MTRSELLVKALEKANKKEKIEILEIVYSLGFGDGGGSALGGGWEDDKNQCMVEYMNHCFNQDIRDNGAVCLFLQKIANR